MKCFLFVILCLILNIVLADVEIGNDGENDRDSRKLFGGYRITPRFCKPTRKNTENSGGPSICMFNHECSQRNGQVVGACMDGFLFGACCQLPAGSTGELIESDMIAVGNYDNNLSSEPTSSTKKPSTGDITSNGVSQITQALLNPSVLPTAQDNVIVQISGDDTHFSTTGVTHPASPDTIVLNEENNFINPNDFTTKQPQTTSRTEETTIAPILHISLSNAPSLYTPSPGFQRPMFRPKPSKPSDADKYVLVPTITHDSKPNKTQEVESIVNIIQMLNDSSTKNPYYGSTSKKPPSTSYIFSSTSTKRPNYDQISTSKKPPSTSYVFSTTFKPRRTTTIRTTTTKKQPSTSKKPTHKPYRKPTQSTTTKKTTTSHVRPNLSTEVNSPGGFHTTKKPPSTSYVYNIEPTRRPPSVINTHVAGPGFSVTSSPGQYSTYPSPAPTLIVLSSDTGEEITTRPIMVSQSTYPSRPIYPSSASYYPSSGPLYSRPTQAIPQRKPVNSVTINNHVTQNIYSTSERPHPTVLITPKPSISTSVMPNNEYNTDDTVEIETSADDLINFPPVRNPNLNMSVPSLADDDITTPAFIEDDALNDKVESFVNKIIQGLQEPFEGLKDVVYNKNKTNSNNLISNTTKKPVKSTTKRPVAKPTTNNAKPLTATSKPPTRKPTTRRPTTKKPATSFSTKKPSTTTKRTKPTKTTKKPTTTTQSFIEEDNSSSVESDDYRSKCGIRPLVKSGRIVGGKGATFGEFPWQVLVRESTWLGLFTKNKCGGVLISNKYVMTAAHCQPGFLASLVAVFGEFDISGDLESKRPISRNVKRVIVHRQYDAATFENDLALLELEAPILFDEHIVPICLPRDSEDFTGRMATVTGWGRLKYGGGVPSVLQEVQVPIMENHVCQEMFRTAGHSKVILESFLCAGYANGQKDSCEGDSGGPLVLQRPDGRYQLAGTVSHGIKCAAPYLPGVYMRTTFYKPWIESITGLD